MLHIINSENNMDSALINSEDLDQKTNEPKKKNYANQPPKEANIARIKLMQEGPIPTPKKGFRWHRISEQEVPNTSRQSKYAACHLQMGRNDHLAQEKIIWSITTEESLADNHPSRAGK
ncbi:hypothetical protein Nepgr_014839 [Nepenthes gracilis]|uniref:Uncharacterized protein n=1 Tax=Nepenthes gracilis TaxID=150966 RepID=A0AAD3SKQ8_NEPGR|nr:hypothetical protein Nepgr_014839 [Nepenthes gracilis]